MPDTPKPYLPDWTQDYASSETATFGGTVVNGVPSSAYPTWMQVYGAGTVVMTNEDGTDGTYTCLGGELITGTWTALVSTTCTNIRLGSGGGPAGAPSSPVPGTTAATTTTLGSVKVSVAAASAASPILVGQNDPAFVGIQTAAGGYVARNCALSNVASLSAYTVAGNDGITNVAGDIVLLVAQTTAAQNGPYVVGTVGSGTAPLTRPSWWATGLTGVNGVCIEISEGTLFGGSTWKSRSTTTGGFVVGTNDPVFYPKKYVRVTSAMSGTPGTKALSAEWIFSTTLSSASPVAKVPGGTQGDLSIGALTAGAGNGSFTVTSTANETSTLQVVIQN